MLAVTMPDPEYAEGEGCYLNLGYSTRQRLLVVNSTDKL